MAATLTTKLKLAYKWPLGETGWNTGMNQNLELLDAITPNIVMANSTASVNITPPGSPVLGGAYWINGVPTGAWAGHADTLGIYLSYGWVFVTPWVGLMVIRIVSGDPQLSIWTGSSWFRTQLINMDS